LLRRSAAALIALSAVLATPPAPKAARILEPRVGAETGLLELVVIEAPGCLYCGVLRRDVLPGYQASARQGEAPLRFVDVNDPAADRLGLDGPATIVPTTVLMKANREVGRIEGAFGPAEYLRLLDTLLDRAR